MVDLSKYEEIIIWGACFSPAELSRGATSHGHAAEKLFNLLNNNGYASKICMWVDSNEKLYGMCRFGKKICSPQEILKHANAAIIINSISMQTILSVIDSMKIDNDIFIIPYYFYHGTLDNPYENKRAYEVVKSHEEEIEKLFEISDYETRRYLDIILTMQKKGMDDLYTREFYSETGYNVDYFCDKNLAPKENVIFIDVGAFEGESIEPVRKFYGSKLKQCIAFEPDENSFKSLTSYVQKNELEEIVKAFPYALGAEEKKITFMEAGGTSQQSEQGNVEITQKIFDNFIEKNPLGGGICMVKMDIEGAEEEALLGMKNFIASRHPYLAICLYHKECDIYKLPKLIKELYPGYKLYIRGGWHLECWAVPNEVMQ